MAQSSFAAPVAEAQGGREAVVLLLAPPEEEAQRCALGQLRAFYAGDVILLAAPAAGAPPEVKARFLGECWPLGDHEPKVIVGEPWTEAAFTTLGTGSKRASLQLRVCRASPADGGEIVLDSAGCAGKLYRRQTVSPRDGATCWITLTPDAEVVVLHDASLTISAGRVQRWAPRLERFYARGEIQRLLDELKEETGLVRLADADFIIDVGFGVGNRDGYEAVVEPLAKALGDLGVRSLVIGGSRKVTEELHLLPLDRQIGQSGVGVNPKVLLAVGISGAPQHLNYIGSRASIIAFNRDPEAPIMTLNRRQPRPRVFPVLGDLFDTVPAFIAALRQEQRMETAPASTHVAVSK